MREIRFRAWDEINKVMEYKVNVNKGNPVKEGFQWFNKENTVHHSELMQYTGLKDKNNFDIYEGDVLDVEDEGYPFVKSWKGVVKFIDGAYVVENLKGTDGEYLYDEAREVEVVGNIYENPEEMAE